MPKCSRCGEDISECPDGCDDPLCCGWREHEEWFQAEKAKHLQSYLAHKLEEALLEEIRHDLELIKDEFGGKAP